MLFKNDVKQFAFAERTRTKPNICSFPFAVSLPNERPVSLRDGAAFARTGPETLLEGLFLIGCRRAAMASRLGRNPRDHTNVRAHLKRIAACRRRPATTALLTQLNPPPRRSS